MPINETLSFETAIETVGGPALIALIALGILLVVLTIIAVYIYFAIAWKTIAKKLKFKDSWLAWVPIANLSMILHLGGFHWAWIFIILIPIAGWIALAVLLIIATWRIFERRNYPGFYSLGILIPEGAGLILYLVAIGFVAWKDMPKRPLR